MDFRQITPDAIRQFLNLNNIISSEDPKTNVERAQKLFLQLGGQGQYPEEVIDLYIASQIVQKKIAIPKGYNINALNTDQFLQVAQLFGLPLTDTPHNRSRASRIIRLLSPKVVPYIFRGPGKVGDFYWMIQQPQYENTLFLYNDNQEQFLQFMKYLSDPSQKEDSCDAGGGNAIIRPYQCVNPPRAAGIPTGTSLEGGYTNLEQAKPVIDLAFDRIEQLLQTGLYREIAYSAGADGRSLGTVIFAPSKNVKEYIQNKIWAL